MHEAHRDDDELLVESTNQRRSRRTVDREVLAHEAELMVGALTADIDAIMGEYTRQLLDIVERIREAQPRTHGAVLLDVSRCGYGCLGCPHPVWRKWVNRQQHSRHSPSTWHAVRIQRPGVAARAKSVPQEARELIAEALVLIERRARFIDHLKRINKAIGTARHYRPELGQHGGKENS
ncbi:hypothetical protein DQ400_15610 [Vreelandella sulfidaeris]|jgi:hypothetical protein|uniref:Uncharacterized protein n=1 Tax=Vreelandella sulfidaeris TaxID=115553 RepID=A0A365TKY0_9GAMM|nr:hypothetical protein [Halomonas sulfidaeris]RBI66164.1 hypothetical protein DQ400_15610 [Halomonas sulfidaeris]